MQTNNSKEKVRQLQNKLYLTAKKCDSRRFHALYDKVYRDDVLFEAWKRVKANKGSSGVDGIRIEDIEEMGIEKYLSEIKLELMDGKYKPSPVKRVMIPKPDGSERPLGIPTVKDRIVQMAAKIAIEPVFEADFRDCSYGFRPKRSAKQALEVVRKACNNKGYYVVDADIEKFFDNVNQDKLMKLAEILERSVDIDGLLELAEGAEELPVQEPLTGYHTKRTVRIALAKDEAFCFFYQDNLELLEEMGAQLIPFSPIHDEKLPKNIDGMLFHGGYPELYAKELEENTAMRKEIKAAVESGMPVVAECGGFLYLHTAIRDRDGHPYQMAGVLPAACQDTKKLVRFGYIELEEKESHFLEVGTRIKGHEFHYFDSEKNGEDCMAVKPITGRTYPCVIEKENVWMGFPHLYYPSNPSFADHFVKKAEQYLGGKYGEFLSFF